MFSHEISMNQSVSLNEYSRVGYYGVLLIMTNESPPDLSPTYNTTHMSAHFFGLPHWGLVMQMHPE